jgi:hypothetical protein
MITESEWTGLGRTDGGAVAGELDLLVDSQERRNCDHEMLSECFDT